MTRRGVVVALLALAAAGAPVAAQRRPQLDVALPTAALGGEGAAVGGRATLIGPIVGAFFVNGPQSWVTVAFPEFWLYFLGALFIAVTLFLPNGLVGLVGQLRRKSKKEPAP